MSKLEIKTKQVNNLQIYIISVWPKQQLFWYELSLTFGIELLGEYIKQATKDTEHKCITLHDCTKTKQYRYKDYTGDT